MARLPKVSQNVAITQGPRTRLSGADIADPYMQVAQAFGRVGTFLQEKAARDASQQGANAVYRDDKGQLQVDLRSDWSKSGEAYDRAAMQAYTARLAGDIRAGGAGLARDAQGNVDTFAKSWKGFSDGLLGRAPPEARGTVATMLDTEFSQLQLGVSEQKRKRDIQTFEGNIKAELQMLDDDMSALARAGGTGTDAYRQKQSQMRSLYSELAANPEFNVGDKEAAIAIKRAESRHMSEAMLGHIDKTLQADGVAAAQAEADRLLTDENLSLSPAERRQYNALADERIRGFIAQRKVELEPWKDKKQKLVGLLKEGIGLDSADVDETAQTLARGGDMAGALELYQARASAKALATFRSLPDADQAAALQRGLAAAEGISFAPDIIDAMRQVESGGDAGAVSPAGAVGHMQVMPDTAAEIATELGDRAFPSTAEARAAYLKKPDVSRRYGTFYFNKMMRRYGGDVEAALVAYNGGPARADAWLRAGRDDSVLPAETSTYYRKVLALTGANEGKDYPIVIRQQAGRISAPDMAGVQPVMLDRFRTLQRMFGGSVPVVSGYRDPDRNRRAGGAVSSRHMHGDALDLDVSGMSREERLRLIQTASAAGFGGIGVYENSIHIDLGGRRAWGADHHRGSVPAWAEAAVAAHLAGKGGAPTTTVDPQLIRQYRAEVTSDAKTLWGDIKDGVKKGWTPSPDDLSLLSRQLALIDDGGLRSEVSTFFETEAGAAAIAQLPADQAEATISAMKSDAVDGVSVAQQDLIEAAQRGLKQRREARSADPVGYAVDHGVAPPVPALDFAAGPDALGPALEARQRAVDLLRARGEVGNVAALRPEDVSTTTRFMQTATPAEQGQLLASMVRTLKPDTLMATMQAISDKGDKALATAGAIYGVNPDAAEGIIRGQALLRENARLAPTDSKENRANIDAILPLSMFAANLEGARQTLLDAATARYADLSSIAGDTSGELNPKRMQQAVTEVTGGMLDFNGSPVIAPVYGMTQDEFDDMTDGLADGDLSGASTSEGEPISARDLRAYGRLRALAAGRYLVEFGPEESPSYAMWSNDATNRDRLGFAGGPFILDLRAGR